MNINQRYRHGTLFCGDCIAIMKTLPAESIRIIVTSPPYNLKNSVGNGMKSRGKGKWTKAALCNGYDGHDDNLPHHEYVAWQRACLNEMMRLLRPISLYTSLEIPFKTVVYKR